MSWSTLLPNLKAETMHALRSLGLNRPSAIQRAVAPRINKGESVAIHAATGSGKTHAFLLPLLARLRMTTPRQALVLVPTRALALQTLDAADALAAAAPDASAPKPINCESPERRLDSCGSKPSA